MLSALDTLVLQAVDILFWPIVFLVFCYLNRDLPQWLRRRLSETLPICHHYLARRGTSLWRLPLALSAGVAWLWLIRSTSDLALALACSLLAVLSFHTTLTFFRSHTSTSVGTPSEPLETLIVRAAKISGGEITKAELLASCPPIPSSPLPSITKALQALERDGVAVRDIDVDADVEYWRFPGLLRSSSRSVLGA